MSDNTLASHITTLFFDVVLENAMSKLKAIMAQHMPNASFIAAGEESAIISFGDMTFAVLSIAAPYPEADLKNLLLHNYVFKDGDALVTKQKHHIIITSMDSAKNQSHSIHFGIALTHLTAVVAQLNDIQAAMWNNSGVLQTGPEFSQSFQAVGKAAQAQQNGEVGGGLLPLTLWIGLRPYSPNQDPNHIGIATAGLNAFTGYNINILPMQQGLNSAAKKLYAMVIYQFESGAMLEEGNSISFDDEQFNVIKKNAVGELEIQWVDKNEQ